MTVPRSFAVLLVVLLLGAVEARAQNDDRPAPTRPAPERSQGVSGWTREKVDQAGEAAGQVKRKAQEEAPKVRDGAVTVWEKVKQGATAAGDTLGHIADSIHDGIASHLK
jgi:hypothetical protein